MSNGCRIQVEREVQWTMRPLGENAIVVSFGDSPGEGTRRAIGRSAAALAAQPMPWVKELVPAYTTLTIYYDPLMLYGMAALESASNELMREEARSERYKERESEWGALFASACDAVERCLASADAEMSEESPRIVDIPVCYGGSFGPDLAEAASLCGLTETKLIRLHTEARYAVEMIGFAPGFPYLSGLPEQLAVPRRAVPRQSVPAGSVGIGGSQTGIYPLDTPGGWQIIGRTPLRLFRPELESPALLATGGEVRFQPISAERYAEIERAEREKVTAQTPTPRNRF